MLDDASHIGCNALISYETLFPYVNPGGLYIVEDWGTGYFNDWPDGKYPERLEPQVAGDRVLSHDFGMVGFVKSLVDQLAGTIVRPKMQDPPVREDTTLFAHFYKHTVILQKL